MGNRVDVGLGSCGRAMRMGSVNTIGLHKDDIAEGKQSAESRDE